MPTPAEIIGSVALNVAFVFVPRRLRRWADVLFISAWLVWVIHGLFTQLPLTLNHLIRPL